MGTLPQIDSALMAREDLTRLLDPTRPVLPVAAGSGSRQNQTRRRAAILAAIRQLLVEEGYKGVTMRRIAELSGYVVQTVYNLVGPRDQAIVQAIVDYSAFVGSLMPIDCDDPAALVRNIDWQVQSVRTAPEFTRQVCLIYFTPDRRIFLQYRDQQARDIQSVLARQKRAGVLRRDADCRQLAQDLMLYSGAHYIEWADGRFPVEELLTRLKSGCANLLASAISPRFGGLARLPF